jgi:hypothetical protein
MLALLALFVAVNGAGGDRLGEVSMEASPEVSVDRPTDADAVLTETSLRIKAELAAEGTTSRITVCAVDPLAGPADCPRDGTAASVALARIGDLTSIFVTSKLKSGLELRRQVRVNDADGGADATLLAVRAVELLRDLKVEVAVAGAGQGQDPEEPKPLEPFAQQPLQPASGPPRWHLVVGMSTLMIPWTNKPTFTPAAGLILGVAARMGQHALLVMEAAGPFANALPIAMDLNNPSADRQLYQGIARLSVRFGRTSALDGIYGAPMVGLSYMHLQLGASNLNGPDNQVTFAIYGFCVGYTKRVTRSVFLTAELDLELTPDVLVESKLTGTLTESGPFWAALNLSAAIPLF